VGVGCEDDWNWRGTWSADTLPFWRFGAGTANHPAGGAKTDIESDKKSETYPCGAAFPPAFMLAGPRLAGTLAGTHVPQPYIEHVNSFWDL